MTDSLGSTQHGWWIAKDTQELHEDWQLCTFSRGLNSLGYVSEGREWKDRYVVYETLLEPFLRPSLTVGNNTGCSGGPRCLSAERLMMPRMSHDVVFLPAHLSPYLPANPSIYLSLSISLSLSLSHTHTHHTKHWHFLKSLSQKVDS